MSPVGRLRKFAPELAECLLLGVKQPVSAYSFFLGEGQESAKSGPNIPYNVDAGLLE